VLTDETLPPAPSGELAAVFGHGFVSTGGGARDLNRQSPSLASATADTDLSDPSRRCFVQLAHGDYVSTALPGRWPEDDRYRQKQSKQGTRGCVAACMQPESQSAESLPASLQCMPQCTLS